MKSGSSKFAEDLQRLYRERFEKRSVYRNAVWRELVVHFFQQFVQGGDTVLDLGAGYGEFINNIHCAKKYAMDLNPDTSQKVQKNVEMIVQDCAQPWPLPDNRLDVVFSSNFFEHLPDVSAFERTLREAKRCLKPGGRLIALGPNIRHTGDAYWEIEDHHLPFTEDTMAEALRQTGFVIEKCIDKFLPFTMSEGPQYPTFFVSIYVRFPLAWRVFGKQFLVVAQKTF